MFYTEVELLFSDLEDVGRAMCSDCLFVLLPVSLEMKPQALKL